MDHSLEGKVIIVTGASSGIGEAVGRRAAALRAKVVLAARRTDRLVALESAITSGGGAAMSVPTDVTDYQSVTSLAAAALDAYGRIDALVNNAGVMPLSPIKQLRVKDWDRMFDVNVRGVLYCIAAVLPTMLEQAGGHIVNVSSVAGRRPFPSGSIYSASKAAVRMLSTGLRLELSPHDHIRVTDIEPGVVATELMDHIPDRTAAQGFATRWKDKQSLSADDVASAVIYAIGQPEHVNVNEILVRPTDQET